MTNVLEQIKEVQDLVREKHGSHNQADHTPHKYRGGRTGGGEVAGEVRIKPSQGVSFDTSNLDMDGAMRDAGWSHYRGMPFGNDVASGGSLSNPADYFNMEIGRDVEGWASVKRSSDSRLLTYRGAIPRLDKVRSDFGDD